MFLLHAGEHGGADFFTEIFLHGIIDTLKLLPKIKGTSGGIIPLAVCVFSLAMSWIISRAVKLFKKKAIPLKTTLTVISDGKELEMSAYCDSGNLLREPVGGLPVIITGKEQMENISKFKIQNS